TPTEESGDSSREDHNIATSPGETDNDTIAEKEEKIASTENMVSPADLKTRHLGFTRTLFLVVCGAMIGTGAQFGYALGVMNAPSEVIKNFTKLIYYRRYNSTLTDHRADLLYSTTISVIALGGVLGGLLAGPICDRLGRFDDKGFLRIGLLLNNIPAITGSILMVLSKILYSYEMLIIGRVLIGFTAGFGAVAGSLYITEIAPLQVRGSFGACFQLFMAMAIMLAQVLGLDIILGNDRLWNYLFIVPIGFSLLQIILLVFAYDTPKFLLQKEREQAAERALKWFRYEKDNAIVQAEIREMHADLNNLKTNSTKITLQDLLQKPLLRKCLLISSMTHVAQQLIGSNVIFYFGDVILARTNLPYEFAPYASLSFGITYLAVAVTLVFILDKVGRRSLFLYGLVGMGVAAMGIGVTILKSKSIRLYHMIFLNIFSIMGHAGFFALGP
ncbi:unnamed protein product, partial [Didymodactylos carnosus]